MGRDQQQRKRSAEPAITAMPRASKHEPATLSPLNFKVPATFHREFKTYAAQHGITMLELLQEGFRLVKEGRGE